jgi:hypothetical protein
VARHGQDREDRGVAVSLPAGDRANRAPVEGRPSDAPSRAVATSPLATALTLTTIATVGIGVAAEPFLRVAFEAAMLGG